MELRPFQKRLILGKPPVKRQREINFISSGVVSLQAEPYLQLTSAALSSFTVIFILLFTCLVIHFFPLCFKLFCASTSSCYLTKSSQSLQYTVWSEACRFWRARYFPQELIWLRPKKKLKESSNKRIWPQMKVEQVLPDKFMHLNCDILSKWFWLFFCRFRDFIVFCRNKY